MTPPDHDRRRRQGRWLGLAGLLGSAALALVSGLTVEFAAEWLNTTARAAWTIAGLAIAAVMVAAWQVYVRVTDRRPLSPDAPTGPRPPRTGQTAEAPVLPADIAEFVGRQEQLAKTIELAGEKPVIAAVGRRGVGTSAFALHAAHHLRERHPDAQVHLDVRPGDRQMRPDQVLVRVCRALRLPEPRFGRLADLDAAGEQLRGWLARKRVLLVLHNIDDPEQVRHALPGVGHSTALLAGTTDLQNLDGVHCLPLEEPSVEEAVDLLASFAGRNLVDAHLRSAEELVRLCGRQPLAVRLLGRKLHDHEWTVERLRRDIEAAVANPAYQNQVEGSDVLRTLWGTCDVAYQRLDRAQQRMFRLLGLAPATEIGAPAAAALAGLTTRRAQRLLEELADLGFVESAANGRYRIRESLMRSARLHLDAERPRRQVRALIRLARHLTGRAATHATALTPVTRRESVEQDLARAQANAWFRDEQDLLHRMIAERHAPGDTDTSPPPTSLQRWLFRMAVPLCLWHAAEQQLPEWGEVCQAILDTPLAEADPAVASWAHNELSAVLRLQGDPAAASEHLAAALPLRPARLRAERAQVETNLGLAWLDRRDALTAMNHFERARRLHGDRYGQALGDLGWGAAHLHDNTPGVAAPLEERLAAAQRSFERCVEVFAELDEQRGLAAARNNLGLVLWRQGDHTGAEEHWDRAEAIYTELEDEAGLARVHLNQAAMLLAGRPDRVDEAVDRLRESLLLRAGGSDTVGTGLCHLHLGTAYAARGLREQARQAWRKAEEIFTTLEADAELAEAKERLRLLDEGARRPAPRPAPPPRTRRPGWWRWFGG